MRTTPPDTATNGISCVTRASRGSAARVPATSWSTFGIVALTAEMSARTALVVVVLVDLPRRAQHEQAELLDLDPRVGDHLLHELLVAPAARPACTRDTARSHIMSKMRRTSPTVRMAWWMRPPPSRVWATTKPRRAAEQVVGGDAHVLVAHVAVRPAAGGS